MTEGALIARWQLKSGLYVVALHGGDSSNKRKRLALNDGNGKQKEIKPAISDRKMTRCASKLEKEENRRMQEFPGFVVGDIPRDGYPTTFKSCWTENSPYPTPKEYEDMAKIGLKTYNCQNDTSYQFTKILGVDSLTKHIYIAHRITFQAEDESSPKNFEAKAGSIRGITVVPFCKLEKGLDVAALDVDRKQTETLSDLARSAFIRELKERQQLLKEENKRIKKGREFDFGDIPPLVLYIGTKHMGTYKPCWSEISLYPVPKLYEDMSKIGIKTYNRQYHTSYQFSKILRVYFGETGKTMTVGLRYISCQAEDTSVASPKNLQIQVTIVPARVMVTCMVEEDPDRITSRCGWYWFAASHNFGLS